MEKYGDNMRNWSSRMSHDVVSYVISNTDEIQQSDNNFREKYMRQEFASKRFGKERYIQTLNDAFVSEGLIHRPLSDGKKYMSDKVGVNTIKRYMSDIISYAEIFTGEYSVTYKEEIEWR
jgi:GH25 family lysozyme M1 (1,4-beta-N-acetylmuramidase)